MSEAITLTDTQRLLLRLFAGEHTRMFTWSRKDEDALRSLGLTEWSSMDDCHVITANGLAYLKNSRRKRTPQARDAENT